MGSELGRNSRLGNRSLESNHHARVFNLTMMEVWQRRSSKRASLDVFPWRSSFSLLMYCRRRIDSVMSLQRFAAIVHVTVFFFNWLLFSLNFLNEIYCYLLEDTSGFCYRFYHVVVPKIFLLHQTTHLRAAISRIGHRRFVNIVTTSLDIKKWPAYA